MGFVGAGLLTFEQALGVVFGANVGTTITGWMVALFGFKVDLGAIAPVLVFVGALSRLLGKGRFAAFGSTLAGFGLLFTGIDLLQEGMAGFGECLTPAVFPPGTWSGRAQLVLLGVLVTLVTQSSSAGVATALSAVHSGAVTFPQAAALVIGMDVGTTFTALLATLGASRQARRTGYSHVVYNVATAFGAFLLLDTFGRRVDLPRAREPGGHPRVDAARSKSKVSSVFSDGNLASFTHRLTRLSCRSMISWCTRSAKNSE